MQKEELNGQNARFFCINKSGFHGIIKTRKEIKSMRIIDKNTDFYDYLTNVYPDNTFTFDRTDSYLLTKEIMCDHLSIKKLYSKHYANRKHYNLLLLQICNTFWLFSVEITKIDEYDKVKDYNIEHIATWKNFNKKRVLCNLDVISLPYWINNQVSTGSSFWNTGYDIEKMRNKKNILINSINNNEFTNESSLNNHIIYRENKGHWDKTEKHIPLLKACGIANCIDPMDVFLAFDEYFSLEKSSSERRDPVGTTNNDKIESHGFDTKTSFRGKQR